MPGAINKIQWAGEIRRDKPKFEIIVKQDGKVVYHNKAFAGVFNFVQSIDKVNPGEGSITGDSQVFGFGNPFVQVFALDQLEQKLLPALLKVIRQKINEK